MATRMSKSRSPSPTSAEAAVLAAETQKVESEKSKNPRKQVQQQQPDSDEPEEVPVAGPAPKPARKLVPDEAPAGYVSPGQGKRTEAMWSYFVLHKPLNPVGKDVKQYAVCYASLQSGHAKCLKKIMTSQSSTSGLRSHLSTAHPSAWSKVLQFQADFDHNRQKTLHHLSMVKTTIETGKEYAKDAPYRPKRVLASGSSSGDDLIESSCDASGRRKPPAKMMATTGTGAESTSPSAGPSRPRVPEAFRPKTVVKHNAQSSVQLKFDLEVMKLLVRCNLPFSLVNTHGLRDFVAYLDPKMHLKDQRTFARSKLPLLYYNVKKAVEEKLAKDLDGLAGVAFTTDLWSSRNFDPYLGLTLHYITRQWKMERILVYCGSAEGRHTAINIADHIDKVIADLSQLSHSAATRRVCTTDNAQNMLSAMKKCTSITSSLGCIDHTLQIIVNSSLEAIPEIVEALDAFRKLVARTHKSSLDQQRISRACVKITKDDTNDLQLHYRKIIAPVATRWNSTLMMIQSILYLRPALELIKDDTSRATQDRTPNSDPKLRAAIPEMEHFDVLEAIVPVLKEVDKITAELSSETTPTICLVVPKLYSLQLVLQHKVRRGTSQVVKDFCKIFLGHMEDRLPEAGSRIPEYAASNLLHPKYKCFILEELGNARRGLDYLVSHFDAQEISPQNSEEGGSSTPGTDAEGDEPLDADQIAHRAEKRQKKLRRQTIELAGAQEQATSLFEAPTASRTLSPIQVELNNFYKESAPKDVDILAFWKMYGKTYPLLAAAASELLCIQATSCSSERTFSTGGLTVTAKRNKLDTDNVHMLVYCKENLPKVTKTIKKWALEIPPTVNLQADEEVEFTS